MFTAVFFQVGATVSMIVIWGLIAGTAGAVSAGIGGTVCFIPNFLFALRLRSIQGCTATAYPAHFFMGESIKVAATIGLLLIAIRVYSDLDWLSLLVSMAIVLQAGFLAFWKKS